MLDIKKINFDGYYGAGSSHIDGVEEEELIMNANEPILSNLYF